MTELMTVEAANDALNTANKKYDNASDDINFGILRTVFQYNTFSAQEADQLRGYLVLLLSDIHQASKTAGAVKALSLHGEENLVPNAETLERIASLKSHSAGMKGVMRENLMSLIDVFDYPEVAKEELTVLISRYEEASVNLGYAEAAVRHIKGKQIS